jgi:hypothetical protein
MRAEDENLFTAIGRDPSMWLAQARQHKLVADALLPHLWDAINRRMLRRGSVDEQFAFIHGYMFNVGLAIENLVKGIEIAADPNLVSLERVDTTILPRAGHGITDGIRRHLTLTREETLLVRRVEEYLFWAGRYPVPVKIGDYRTAEKKLLRTFNSDDPEVLDSLINKLIEILQGHCGVPPN